MERKLFVRLLHLSGFSSVYSHEKYDKLYLLFENGGKSRKYRVQNLITLNIKITRHIFLNSTNSSEKISIFAKKCRHKDYICIGSVNLSYYASNGFNSYDISLSNGVITLVAEYFFNYCASRQVTGSLSLFKEEDFVNKKLVGSGSFARVIRVFHSPSKRFLAYKEFFRNDLTIHSDEIRREALISQIFDHPTIVKCEGYVLNADGRHVSGLVFEYVDGFSLCELFSMEATDTQPLSWGKTQKTKVLYGISYGLSILHAHGIIHRDLNPSNIMIDDHFEPHICDFGISRTVDEKSEMTFDVGTADYQSPEQQSGSCNYSSDIYSLGQIVYQLSSMKMRKEGDCDLKLISSNLRVVLRAMLDNNPSKRPRIADILFMIEHGMMQMNESNCISDYISKVKQNSLNPWNIMRNDFISEEAKATAGDDESLSSVAIQSFMFGETDLSSEYFHLLVLMDFDVLSLFIECYTLSEGVGIAKNYESIMNMDKLYQTEERKENYRYGLIDMQMRNKNIASIFLEGKQVLQGLLSPYIYVTADEEELKVKDPYNDRLIRKKLSNLFLNHIEFNEFALFAYSLFQTKEDGNFDFDTFFHNSSILYDKYFSTYSLEIITDNTEEDIFVLGDSHNVLSVIEIASIFYYKKLKSKEAYHYALRGSCNGSLVCLNRLGIISIKWYNKIDEGMIYLKDAACYGHVKSMIQYGYFLLKFHNEEEGLNYIQNLSNNFPEIFICFLKYIWKKVDEDTRLDLFQKLAERNIILCIELLIIIYKGKDIDKYGYYAKKGAEIHFPFALQEYAAYVAEYEGNYELAIELLEESIKLGNKNSYKALACLYIQYVKDQQKYLETLKRGADAGDESSAYFLSYEYKRVNEKKQWKKYHSIGLGDMRAEMEQAMFLFNTHRDDEALSILLKAYQNNVLESYIPLFNIYIRKKDYSKAFQIAQEMAEVYNDKIKLGVMYMFGLGVETNSELAEQIFLKGAENGSPEAHFRLGQLYRDQDRAKSYHYLTIASELGMKEALNELATYKYVDGDYASAYHVSMELACKADANGQAFLGNMYRLGEGVGQDFNKAAYYFSLAAEQGNIEAQYNIGIFLLNGTGVKKDMKSGYYFILDAAKKGCEAAITTLNEHPELQNLMRK